MALPPPMSDIMMQQHAKYYRSLPLNQQSALRQYIKSSSYLNQLLREGFNVRNDEHCKFYGLEMTQRVENMDNALSRDDLRAINKDESPFTVFRGISSPTLGQVIERTGHLHHPHFMSTSTLLSVATHNFGGSTCCVFQTILDPSKDTCPDFLYISNNGSSESEVLIARNTYLNLMHKYIDPNTKQQVYVVEASTIPKRAVSNANSNSSANAFNSRAAVCNANARIAEMLLAINMDDVEDELAFLSDKDMEDDDVAIDAISTSLHKTFRGAPLDKIKEVVSQYYMQLKRQGMNTTVGGRIVSGKRPKRTPEIKGKKKPSSSVRARKLQ